MNYFDYIRIFDPLIDEYLHLSYENPNLAKEVLLTQFRDLVRNDRVSIEFPSHSYR